MKSVSCFVLIYFTFFLSVNSSYSQTPTEVTIEYIAHSSFIIHAGDKSILLDPYADRVWIGYDFPKKIKTDLVLISHPHYDHDGGLFTGKKPYWFFNTTVIQNPDRYTLGPFNIRAVVGKHAKHYGAEFRQLNTIWILEVDGLTIAHLGDNQLLTDDNMKIVGEVDILLVPLDDKEHILTFSEFKKIRKALNPSLIIPMHYRIEELEPNPNTLATLGSVEELIKREKRVIEHDGHKYTVNKSSLPGKQSFLILQHSPEVPLPENSN